MAKSIPQLTPDNFAQYFFKVYRAEVRADYDRSADHEFTWEDEFDSISSRVYRRNLDGLSGTDDVLLCLFMACQKEVEECLKFSLPENVNQTYNGPSIEWVGPVFHSSFRKFDVTSMGKGHIDMAIWHALDGPSTSMFWKVLTAMCAIYDRQKVNQNDTGSLEQR